MIFNMSGGGGGTSLNYSVVGGTSTPSNPKENTIWVNTEAEITSHVFSATEPTSPSEGMVWFSTSTSSPVEFNALKKNGIQVYPISAEQHVSGVWVKKETKTYQGGEWADWWNGELYVNGDLFTGATGGWKITNVIWRTDQVNHLTPEVTYNSDNIYIYKYGGNGSCTFSPVNKIDLSEFATLEADIDVVDYRELDGIAVWKETAKTVAANVQYKKRGRQTITLDVSKLSGEYYVGFRMSNGNESYVKINIYSVRLKR